MHVTKPMDPDLVKATGIGMKQDVNAMKKLEKREAKSFSTQHKGIEVITKHLSRPGIVSVLHNSSCGTTPYSFMHVRVHRDAGAGTSYPIVFEHAHLRTLMIRQFSSYIPLGFSPNPIPAHAGFGSQ